MTASRLALALAGVVTALSSGTAGAESILFIGNSVTDGEGASLRGDRPDAVIDLRGSGIGGVRAPLQSFTVQARRPSDAFLLTEPGSKPPAFTALGLETGLEPRRVGGNETAAAALGFTPQQAMSLQAIDFQAVTPVPEPQTWATLALGLAALGVFVRGRDGRRTAQRLARAG